MRAIWKLTCGELTKQADRERKMIIYKKIYTYFMYFSM
jgi:hypothetical protein